MAENITSLRQLRELAGQVVKWSEDGGKTWEYGRLQDWPEPMFLSDKFDLGYSCSVELKPDGVDRMIGLTVRMIRDGLIVQAATPEEARGKRFAYDPLQ